MHLSSEYFLNQDRTTAAAPKCKMSLIVLFSQVHDGGQTILSKFMWENTDSGDNPRN